MPSYAPEERPDHPCYSTSSADNAQAPHGTDTPQMTTSEIVAIIIHQLSTPISSLLVSSEMLLTSHLALQPNEVLAELRRIRRNTIWLQSLLENLKISASLAPLIPHWDKICPSESIDSLLSLIQPVLERRQQAVVLTEPSEPVHVWGDRQWLEQILMNLLENASKYSEPETVIQIAVIPDAEWIRVVIKDSGPGISLAEQEQIFQPYVRGTSANHAGVTGLGLGLHVVRSLVDAHRGTVGVESQLGQGASFWFTLPRWEAGNRPPSPLSRPEPT